MLDQLLLMILSVLVLAKASQWVIGGSLKLAAFFGLSEIAVGFLLLSVATSLPELAVSLTSAFGDKTSISVGNVLGANIADVALVLGITALVGKVAVKKHDVPDVLLLLILVSLLPFFFLSGIFQQFSPFYGLFLLGIFATYSYMTLRKRSSSDGKSKPVTPNEAVFSAFAFCIGIAVVLLSAQYVVSSAVALAQRLRVSEALVSATVISMGTTLPELAVNLEAMRRHHPSLAIGNIVGSAVTNLTLILGLAALVNPLVLQFGSFMYLVVSAFAVNLLLLFFLRRHKGLFRTDGYLLLFSYLLFLGFSLFLETSSLLGAR